MRLQHASSGYAWCHAPVQTSPASLKMLWWLAHVGSLIRIFEPAPQLLLVCTAIECI